MIILVRIAKEVKGEILVKVKAGQKVSVLAEQYGISDRTIYAWIRGKAQGTASLVELRRVKRENEELKQIVGALSLELTKLKKRKLISTRG